METQIFLESPLNFMERKAKAAEIVKQAQQSYPVKVVSIARELGIPVYQENLGAAISGVLRKDDQIGGPSGYVIIVNDRHNKNRQRFTVAHELGHFVLHSGLGRSEIKDDEFYRALSGPLEREANDYAANLLMPWHLISRLQDEGIRELDEMAVKLEVSRQALAIRLGLPYDQSWD